MGKATPKSVLRKIYDGWMWIALKIGFVMTRIQLTLIYVVILGPMRLVEVALGKDFLDRRRDDRSSNWHEVAPQDRKIEDYYHLF